MTEKEIKAEDLRRWLAQPSWDICASYSTAGHYQRIEVDRVTGRFRVVLQKQNGMSNLYDGSDIDEAVAAYNKAIPYDPR